VSVARQALRVVGTLLSVAGVAWIVLRFAESGLLQRVASSSRSGQLALRIAQAIPVYAAGVVVLCVAWWFLQGTFSARKLRVYETVVNYGTTQFGKYLPGNVGQYLGRHVMLSRLGLSHAVLVACALAEAGLLVCAALVWGAPLMNHYIPGLPTATWLVTLPVLFLASVALFSISHSRIGWLGRHIPVFAPGGLFVALSLYLLFFLTMALTLQVVASSPDMQVAQLSAVAALSWAAGYLVIGAPAGLGVREAVFLALLHGRMPEDQILLMAGAFRIATFGGDLLVFLLALPLNARLSRAR
jgi:glycosyltransferase 2 family protein